MMALTITDVSKSATDTGINSATTGDGSEVTGSELDRGANTIVQGPVEILLTLDTWGAAPDGKVEVHLNPLDSSGGTLFDDRTGPYVFAVSADQTYNISGEIDWPGGARYVQATVLNDSGQQVDITLELRWQTVTV